MRVSDEWDMTTNQAGLPSGTLVLDPNIPAHVNFRQALPDWRAVPFGELIGRDVSESTRLCVADWRIFGAVPHLREKLMQQRGRTIVVVGLSDEPTGTDALDALRRFAGEVVALADEVAPEWASRLLVPVTLVNEQSILQALEEACKRTPEALGSVEVHLREAMNYVHRGDSEGAFQSSARALALAPDQPGIVADVARLLASMGRSSEGEQLCRSFLLQRPDDSLVKGALDELTLQHS